MNEHNWAIKILWMESVPPAAFDESSLSSGGTVLGEGTSEGPWHVSSPCRCWWRRIDAGGESSSLGEKCHGNISGKEAVCGRMRLCQPAGSPCVRSCVPQGLPSLVNPPVTIYTQSHMLLIGTASKEQGVEPNTCIGEGKGKVQAYAVRRSLKTQRHVLA